MIVSFLAGFKMVKILTELKILCNKNTKAILTGLNIVDPKYTDGCEQCFQGVIGRLCSETNKDKCFL